MVLSYLNDKIYTIGGKTRFASYKHISDRVFMYDLITQEFKEMAPLNYAVWAMATVSWKDNVVVIGGENKDRKALNTVIMYNVNTGRNTMLPEMGKK